MFKFLDPFIVIVLREIKWMRKHREYRFLTILGPLIGFFLIVAIFNKGVVRDIDVAIIDNDNTKTSRQIARMIDATSIAKISYQTATLLEAEELMLKGKVSAIIDIKEGVEKNILKKGDNANVIIYINGANILKDGLLKSGIIKAVSTFNAGVQVQVAMKTGKNYRQAVAGAVPIIANKHVLFNPYVNYFYFLATILMPVILILFTLISSIYSLGSELRSGTAKKALKKANNSIIVLTIAKLFPYTILFLIQALIFNYTIFDIMGFPIRGNYFIVVFSELLLIISYQALGVFLLGVFGNLRLAVSLGSAYSMMALTFSGLTFPEFGMPPIAQMFSRIFPLSYWLDVFLGQTLRNDPLRITMPQLLYLFIFIIIGTISMFWLKHKYQNEKFWNKI